MKVKIRLTLLRHPRGRIPRILTFMFAKSASCFSVAPKQDHSPFALGATNGRGFIAVAARQETTIAGQGGEPAMVPGGRWYEKGGRCDEGLA